MNEKEKQHNHPFIAVAKARGWQHAAALLLDALAPIAPLASQLLWTVQPVAGVFGMHEAVRDLADMLDEPDGVATLREQLAQKGESDK